MVNRSLTLLSTLAVTAGVSAITNCASHPAETSTGGSSSSSPSSSSGASTGGAGGGPSQFTADPPRVYVAKVKNLLVGLPPTDDEVKQVEASPAALRTLIMGWMALPQYDEKMLRFFELAFQQTQITTASFIDLLPQNGIGAGPGIPGLMKNIEESFARTVLELIKQGQPLNAAVTTKTFMMTPPLMEFYAFLDRYHVDDLGKADDKALGKSFPTTKKMVQGFQGFAGITLAQSADATNASTFMQWYNPDLPNIGNMKNTQCIGNDPITYPLEAYPLHFILYGTTYGHQTNGTFCPISNSPNGDLFPAADYSAWKMVTVRPPQDQTELVTPFYDIPLLEDPSTTELVLHTPYVGFFSTPAFWANWSTNQSNQMRVTTNQALIIATGMQIDGTDMTAPTDSAAVDQDHAGGNAACFKCHQTLDETRAILANTWTYSYYDRDPVAEPTSIPNGQFVFQNWIKPVSNIDDFATALSTHPAFPSAWVQKLCTYANSAPCDPSDPEFQRIVGVFQSSALSWNALVVELLSSPLTTNALPTKTTQEKEVVAVSRRDHLCTALDVRLGLTDICGLGVSANSLKGSAQIIALIAAGLPSDGYGRGATMPVLPNDPTLFYAAGMENICEMVSQLVIDNAKAPAATKHWSSTSPANQSAAMNEFVSLMMGLTTSDPRAQPSTQALQDNFNNSVATGASASDSLKNTFVVACLSPSFVGIGN